MKGKWLIKLVSKVLAGRIAPADAGRFFRARLAPKSLDLHFQGVTFHDLDHILWSLIAEIFVNEEYTPPGYSIGAGDQVVDIGAHKGVFVAFAAGRTQAPILAYEPDPDNVAQLRALIQANHWDHIELRPMAVAGKTDPELRLYKAVSSSRNSIMRVDVLSGQALTEVFEVQALSLDEALSGLARVDFLKLDCEGAEYEILAQAGEQTLAKIQKLVMEYHRPPSGSSLSALLALIKRHFHEVRLAPQSGSELGYIYARKPYTASNRDT